MTASMVIQTRLACSASEERFIGDGSVLVDSVDLADLAGLSDDGPLVLALVARVF